MILLRILKGILNAINSVIKYITDFLASTFLFIPFLYLVFGIVMYVWFGFSFSADANGKIPFGTVMFYIGLVLCCICAFALAIRKLYNKIPTQKTTEKKAPYKRGKAANDIVDVKGNGNPPGMLRYNGQLYAKIEVPTVDEQPYKRGWFKRFGDQNNSELVIRNNNERNSPIRNGFSYDAPQAAPFTRRTPINNQTQPQLLSGLNPANFVINGETPKIYPHPDYSNIMLFEYSDRVLCYINDGYSLRFMRELPKSKI